MNLSGKVSISAELGWLHESSGAATQHILRGLMQAKQEYRFTSEAVSGDTEKRCVWAQKNISIPAGATHLYDFLSLPTVVIDDYVTLELERVYAIFLVHNGPVETLEVGGGERMWTGLSGEAGGIIRIPSDGFIALSAEQGLCDVTDETHLLRVHNAGESDSVYDVAFVGRRDLGEDDEDLEPGGSSSSASGSL